MKGLSDLDLVSYILFRVGCEHPFRLSRILLLADWTAEERLGRRFTSGLGYRAMGFGFHVDGLEEVLEELEKQGRARMNLQRGCVEYLGEPPSLPPQAARILDEVIARTMNLDDLELNALVVRDPRYLKWVE